MDKTIAVKKPRELSLSQLVELETKNREILTSFIAHHMKKGIDYGPIHINKTCPNKYNCDLSYHFSKDCLFKPGSEKFASLMKLTPRFHKDADTWEMAGSQPGLFCYVCELVNTKSEVVGEGRGACATSEKGNPNTAIKIAEKRAQIDAVLRSGGLSDFFTQDLEDMAPETEKPEPPILRKTYDLPSKTPPVESSPVPTNETRMELSKIKIELARLIKNGIVTEITYRDLQSISLEKAKEIIASTTA